MTAAVDPVPGMELGSLTVTLTEELWQEYIRGAGHAAAPNPLMAVKEYVRLLTERTGITKLINMGVDTEFQRAPRMGETVTLRPVIQDVFERKGRRFVQVRSQATDAAGALILTTTTTMMLRGGEGDGR